MFRIYTVSLLFFAAEVFAGHAPLHGMDADTRIPGQYIVVLKDSAAPRASQLMPEVARQMARDRRGQVLRRYGRVLNGFAMRLADAEVQRLASDPRVAYIEADRRVSLNATQSPATWGLDRIDQRDLPVDNSYTYNADAATVHAYVIDTGIRTSHNEFAGRASAGFSSVNDGRGTSDCNGHGTHVAGTLGGVTYGVAKQVRLVAVRVLDCQGSGALSGVIAGVDWVTANHIAPAVANMSLGSGSSVALDNAVRNSIAAGVSYVVAAGNSNQDACTASPARIDEAITVGATTSSDRRASYSNWGSCVDVMAPGSSIRSAWATGDNATNVISGTSMASPHAAGVAALYLSDQPSASPAQVLNAVVSTATAGRLADLRNSPDRLVYSLLDNADTGADPGPANCPSGFETHDAAIPNQGTGSFQPNDSYYFANTGTHEGVLHGPASADFDLHLWRWNGSAWASVAQAETFASEESLSYTGSSGYYVWRVFAYRGSGPFRFCLRRP